MISLSFARQRFFQRRLSASFLFRKNFPVAAAVSTSTEALLKGEISLELVCDSLFKKVASQDILRAV